MSITRVLLIRHGATVLSAEDRFAGATDVALSDEGRFQASALGDRLAEEKIAAVYASPMQRTLDRPVGRFLVYDSKKRKNKNGKSQLRKHIIKFRDHEEEFELFYRLLKDATQEIQSRKSFLPNPTDMFDGKNSLEVYRWGLVGE